VTAHRRRSWHLKGLDATHARRRRREVETDGEDGTGEDGSRMDASRQP
jgi:hypothetical protein